MRPQTILDWKQLEYLVAALVAKLHGHARFTGVFGIPTGGAVVGAMVAGQLRLPLVDTPTPTTLVVDDICDSGKTLSGMPSDCQTAVLHARAKSAHLPTYVVEISEDWICYPFEHTTVGEEVVTRMLELLGEDPTREGLVDTPARVLRSWSELFSGYKREEPELTSFTDTYDEMVVSRNIDFMSACVVGSTLVETPTGRWPISHLADGTWIYSFNETRGQFELEQAHRPRITQRRAELVRVYTDKDVVFCTPDHRILTFEKGWVQAGDLANGDEIVALNRGARSDNNTKVYRPQLRTLPGWQQEHQFVYEQVHGRVGSGSNVHHLDHQTWNNTPENLSKLTTSRHGQLHALVDGRGTREAKRWSQMSERERLTWDRARRRGLKAVHLDPERRRIMLEKRAATLTAYWSRIKADPKAYRRRIANMNHRVLAVNRVPWREDVWCLSVPRNHNFVGNGLVLHNCEHHMLPFYGKAHVCYIPNGKVVGVSKLTRVVDYFARRLQIQERLTQQIADKIVDALAPRGVGVVLQGTHLCMVARGVKQPSSVMVTSAVRGALRNDPAARSEFLSLSRTWTGGA